VLEEELGDNGSDAQVPALLEFLNCVIIAGICVLTDGDRHHIFKSAGDTHNV
jgi:hypothetical protein